MANTLTNLIPSAYAALDVVSRELSGMIPAVTLDARASMAASGQTIYVPVVPESNALVDATPAMSVPAAADQTIGSVGIVIDRLKVAPFSWSGEEEYATNQGPGFLSIQQNQIAQAMRRLVNAVEVDLCALHTTASRAGGAVGTAPFGTDTSGMNAARKILVDNGAPTSDLQLVVNTTAGASIRTLFGINGSRDSSRDFVQEQGVIVSPGGIPIRESAQIVNSTAGTASGATTNNAGYAVGATTITLASAGTGTLVAGDVITFAGDANQYVVETGDADVSNGGSVVLRAPGLRKAIAASATNITVIAACARNMMFSRSAIVLATRIPKRPTVGDMAIDVMNVTDPRTGLTFEISAYPGTRMVRYEVALAWGVKNIKTAHSALLLGPVG